MAQRCVYYWLCAQLHTNNSIVPSVTGNAISRDLYNDKCFFYREIARQRQEEDTMTAAIAATQVRLDAHTSRGGGWKGLLKLLQTEQKEKKRELVDLLDKLDTTESF